MKTLDLRTLPTFIAHLRPLGPITADTRYAIDITRDGVLVPGVFAGEFSRGDAYRALLDERYHRNHAIAAYTRTDRLPSGPACTY